MKLDMLKFYESYMLKQNPTYMRRVYIPAKHDNGLKVMVSKNEKNWKQYFFYVSSKWETNENEKRLVIHSWADMKLIIKNTSSYIMTLSSEAKERLAPI